jgi:hypothetical protein
VKQVVEVQWEGANVAFLGIIRRIVGAPQRNNLLTGLIPRRGYPRFPYRSNFVECKGYTFSPAAPTTQGDRVPQIPLMGYAA